MNPSDDLPRINRRVALKWIATAAASLPIIGRMSLRAEEAEPRPSLAKGYGSDPDLLKTYKPGDLWPLTFTVDQRRLVIVLCDIIVPADDKSPSASSLGVHDFIDEWISSPYPEQTADRKVILKGLETIEEMARQRGADNFIGLRRNDQLGICQELAVSAKQDKRVYPGSFFQLFRDLTAGGYFTTPVGMKDLGYVGNVPLAKFPEPPREVLERLGVT